MANDDSRGRFVWHELMTSDPAAAQTFYKQVIGWDTQKYDGGGMDYTMWMAGSVPVGGVMAFPPGAKEMGAPPNWLAYVEVPNVDDTVGETVKRGGGVVAPAQVIPDVGKFAVLRDPQGAVFAVITSANAPNPEDDPQLHEFSWHELATTDWKSAADFYNAIFGWEKKSEFDMGDMGIYYMYGRDRFTYGGMMNRTPEMTSPNAWLHYVRVDSADAAAERATSAGGKVLMGPIEVPGGDRVAILMDPQGAAFAVHSKKSA